MFSLTIHSSTLSTRRPYVTDVATLAANLAQVIVNVENLSPHASPHVPLQMTLVIRRVSEKLVQQNYALERLYFLVVIGSSCMKTRVENLY